MYNKFEQREPFALLDTSKYPPEVAGRFNSFITTQFDDSLSVEMQMRSIIKWAIDNFKEMDQKYNDFTEYVVEENLNPFIQFLNDLIEYMNYFIETFDEKYQETILDKMQEWYDNGELETLINESLDTKYHEMDERLTAQLEDMGVNIRNYGAISDGTFHSIRDTLPNYEELDLTSLHPDATPDNSVDWYAIQMALKEHDVVRVVGDCVVDLPITITSNNKRLIGENGKTILRNIGENIDTIVIGGNDRAVVYDTMIKGITIRGNRQIARYGIYLNNVSTLTVEECNIINHEYGVYSADNNSVWIASFKKCTFQFNKKSGVKLKHFYAHQKNAIKFDDCLISHNGYDESDQNLYNGNERSFDFGHGIEVSGTALSVINTTIEMNSGAGLFLGGDGQQDVLIGVNVSGCYFEPNLLADIFIDNELNNFQGNINGNYLGADIIEGALYKGIHIKQRGNVSGNSNINNNHQYFTTNKDYFNHNGEVKLNQNSSTRWLSPFLFKRGQYELNVDFDWHKITSNSQCRFGLVCLDYDGNELNRDTTPSYVQTPYARLSEDVEESTTVLKFEDLTGFDINESNYDWLVVYDTVLSTGKIIGTDYSTTLKYKTGITINVSNNTITLPSPIGRNIKSGTKVSLNSSSGIGTLLSYYMTVSDVATKRSSRTFNTENIPSEKHIYYLRPVIHLDNANNINDELSILRLSYDKKPFEIINEDWKSVSPINGWTGNINYRKNAVGQLELRGNPFGGTRSANTVLFTLPEGYRTSKFFTLGGLITDGSVGVAIAEITSSNGEVKLRYDTALTQLHFDGTVIPI